MSNAHVAEWALNEALKANAVGAVISDRAARQLAHAYAWSWASCWFEATGDIAFPYRFNHAEDYCADPADYMDQSLFGWWMDSEDSTREDIETDRELRKAMRAYLDHRLAADGGGAVEGWQDFPRH